MSGIKTAKFSIGQVVRHRLFPFRGLIFDVDPEFNNTEEWYQAIPAEVRPRKDQPFYHLLAENSDSQYIAYVSEQNLLDDSDGAPLHHPQIREFFDKLPDGRYEPKGRPQHCKLLPRRAFAADEEGGDGDSRRDRREDRARQHRI
jgi:heat shock protein HspQ